MPEPDHLMPSLSSGSGWSMYPPRKPSRKPLFGPPLPPRKPAPPLRRPGGVKVNAAPRPAEPGFSWLSVGLGVLVLVLLSRSND